MKSGINTFIFDCFGVICDPVLNGWYRDNMLNKGKLDYGIHEVFRKFDLGILSEADVIDHFSKYDGVNITKEQLRKDIDNYLKLDSDLEKIIKKLKDSGYKTVLLSNANNSFFERKVYSTYPNFKNLFDEIIISSNIGLIKPNADMYLYALKQSKAKPEESLFIDDSKVNVEGAEKVGIQGYLYTDSKSFTEYINSMGLDLK